jgi:hypothetical protein
MGEVISSPTSININNYNGLTFTSSSLGIHKYIYLQSSDKIMLMEIVDSTNDPNKQGYQETVGQILSTFKFL